MPSECEGCLSFRKNQSRKCFAGVKLHLSKTEECPCGMCLVKSMCSSGCEVFQDYKRLCRAKLGYELIWGPQQ